RLECLRHHLVPGLPEVLQVLRDSRYRKIPSEVVGQKRTQAGAERELPNYVLRALLLVGRLYPSIPDGTRLTRERPDHLDRISLPESPRLPDGLSGLRTTLLQAHLEQPPSEHGVDLLHVLVDQLELVGFLRDVVELHEHDWQLEVPEARQPMLLDGHFEALYSVLTIYYPQDFMVSDLYLVKVWTDLGLRQRCSPVTEEHGRW